MQTDAEFQHLLQKCHDAIDGRWLLLSTGERLAAALALNRVDWLQAMGYTIPEAIDRIGPAWTALLPSIATALRDES